MKRDLVISMAAVVFAFCSGTNINVNAATNLVSNTVTVTNRVKQVVTYTMKPDGTAEIQDPSGKLIGTAQERALRFAANNQELIATAAQDSAAVSLMEWNDFIRTNDTHVVYISADFTQDVVALTENLCGWVASSFYDGENDHYWIWFNREMDYPPSLAAKIRSAGGDRWIQAEWADYSVSNLVHGAWCRELIVKRTNKNCVLKTGSTISLGGPEGFDFDIHKCNVEVNGTPAATTTIQLPSFYTLTAEGTNIVKTVYTDGNINIENGFTKAISQEEEE